MIVRRGEENFGAGNFLCGLPRDTYFMVCYTKSPKDGRRIAALGLVTVREPDRKASMPIQ